MSFAVIIFSLRWCGFGVLFVADEIDSDRGETFVESDEGGI